MTLRSTSDVKEHKRVIPFRRFPGGVGRESQVGKVDLLFTILSSLPSKVYLMIVFLSFLAPHLLGGVVISTTNALIYVDQSSRRLALPLNGWTSRLSDVHLLPITPADESRKLMLEGSRSVFVDEKTFFNLGRWDCVSGGYCG